MIDCMPARVLFSLLFINFKALINPAWALLCALTNQVDEVIDDAKAIISP